jgi:hypothetical protein
MGVPLTCAHDRAHSSPSPCAQVRAASEALLLTAAATGQPGGAPSPAAEPAAYLEALLQRLAGLNREGYFDNPVDEEEAPGWVETCRSLAALHPTV